MPSPDEPSAPAAPSATPAAFPQRIALFGGSFDPPHNGHLAIAHAALTAFQLDSVLFAPVARQPLKIDFAPPTEFAHRAAMTALAIAHEPRFALSLLDAPRDDRQPNFTVDALLRLRAQHPPLTRFFFLLGADALQQLPRWHRAAEIPFLATLLVASRPDSELGADPLASAPQWLPPTLLLHRNAKTSASILHLQVEDAHHRTADIFFLHGLNFDISASHLRLCLSAPHTPHLELATLLPASVLDYIRSHHLYLA